MALRGRKARRFGCIEQQIGQRQMIDADALVSIPPRLVLEFLAGVPRHLWHCQAEPKHRMLD
eukprot:2312-Prymnesium_polylepis.1